MIIYSLKKNQITSILCIYLCIPFTPVIAFEALDYFSIDKLVERCFSDAASCDMSLLKIHNYQKNAAINKNFSCQTRLLGLEANLIMAMNFNLKRREAKSLIQSVKKYC